MKNTTNILLGTLVILVALAIFKNHSLDLNVSEHKNNAITISGKAEREVVPDTAKISFAVNEYNKDQSQAADKVNKKIKRVIDTLKDLDVDQKDIKTKNYSIYPEYNWNNGKRTFRNFRVSQSVEVKVRDLEKLSKIIARITELKIDNFSGPHMFIDKREEILEELRENAINDAKEKAKELAAELGVSLDKIIGFSENSNGGNYIRPMYKMAMMSDAVASESIEEPEINPGQEKITKTVSITFQIVD